MRISKAESSNAFLHSKRNGMLNQALELTVRNIHVHATSFSDPIYEILPDPTQLDKIWLDGQMNA